MRHKASQISLDQLGAFVELARQGSIRTAARTLCLSEEGLRSRLLALEERLGVSLYEKERGRRHGVKLTPAGLAFLDKATRLLEEARELAGSFKPEQASSTIRLLISETLPPGLSCILARDFHAQYPEIAMSVAACSQRQLMSGLQTGAGPEVGICAPGEFPEGLVYRPWLSLDWSLLAPRGGRLAQQPQVAFEELVAEPLIAFEADTTEQRHVLEAFRRRNLVPRIGVTVTSFQMAIRMVETGMGVALLPLPPAGVHVSDEAIARVPTGDAIRPVQTYIVTRAASQNAGAVHAFLDFVSRHPLSVSAAAGAEANPSVHAGGSSHPDSSEPIPRGMHV